MSHTGLPIWQQFHKHPIPNSKLNILAVSIILVLHAELSSLEVGMKLSNKLVPRSKELIHIRNIRGSLNVVTKVCPEIFTPLLNSLYDCKHFMDISRGGF